MKKNKIKLPTIIIVLLIISAITIACGKQPGPDWVSNFVVFQGNTYEMTDLEVNQIGKEIGKIKKLVNDSAIHSGTFSNIYPRGTLLYEITDVDIKQAIAVEISEGEYLQANYKSKYGK